jgi:hypothetical protein
MGRKKNDQLIDGINARERRYAIHGTWDSDSDTDEDIDAITDEDRRELIYAQNTPVAHETQAKRT